MRRLAVLAVMVLVLSACWEQRGFDGGNARSSPLPTPIGVTNVGSLMHRFTAAQSTGTRFAGAVSGGRLFAVGDHLYAFDVAGCSGPAPASCPPLWRSGDGGASGGFGADVVVGGGKVWVVRNGLVLGFDPAGGGCPTPTTCAPVTTITTPHGAPYALRWIDGTLQVTDWVGAFTGATGHHYHYAYESNGTLRWQVDLGTTNPAYQPVTAVGDGHTLIVGLPLGTPLAFDNRGITGCSGTPKVCQPQWTYAAQNPEAVRAGVLYARTDTGLAAFDAHGVQSCAGTPKVCHPLWTTTDTGEPITVGSRYLYARVGASGRTAAFALDGTSCGGSPTIVCRPLWTYVAGASDASHPASAAESSEAGGVVYTSSHVCGDASCSTPGHWYVDAHDAAGSAGCAGTPKVCSALWSQVIPFRPDDVMVVGDTVYVTAETTAVGGDPVGSIWRFRTS
jgi:hypothetical protein